MKNTVRNIKSTLIKTFSGAVVTASLIELAEVGAGFADMLTTTHILGSDKAAAIGIAYPLFSIVGIFSGVLALGMQLICSEEIARGNSQKMNRCFSTVLSVALALAGFLTVFFLVFDGSVVELLGARKDSGTLYTDSKEYIRGLVVGLPPLFLYPILAPIVQLDGGGKSVRISVICSTFVDVILNFVFIKAGAGMFGVGLASACSYYSNCAIMLVHFLNKNRQFRYIPAYFDLSVIKDVIIKGKSKALKRVANFIRPVIINNYIIYIGGAMAMSALSIRNNIADFIMVAGAGISGAVSMISGIAYSEKNKSDLRLIVVTAHKNVFCIILPISVLLLIFSKEISGLLVSDNDQLQSLVSFAVGIYSVELIADVLVSQRISYLAATSKTIMADALTLFQKLIFIVPCVLIMGAIFGVRGVIAAFAVSNVLIIITIWIYESVDAKSISLGFDDILLLDNSFDDSPKSTIILDIIDMEDAALVAEQIQLFCKGHKFESKRAYMAALCMEETVFSLLKENNQVPEGLEIYCKISGDDLIMRFRYNENINNPFNRNSRDKTEDNVSKIGIKIIQKTAKSIKTFSVFKMHYVVICI